MRQCKTTGSFSTTVLKHFPCAQISPWVALAVPTCFTQCPEKVFSVTYRDLGRLPWTEGAEDAQAGWDLNVEVWGRDQTNSFHRTLGQAGICAVASGPTSAAQGHPSWLLALFLL